MAVIVTLPEQLSCPVAAPGSNETLVAVECAGNEVLMLAGQLIVGGVVSTTFTVRVCVVVLWPSLTV